MFLISISVQLAGGMGTQGVSPQVLQQLGIDGPLSNSVFVSNVSLIYEYLYGSIWSSTLIIHLCVDIFTKITFNFVSNYGTCL